MLMHNRKGTTIVTQQEKVTNETRQQMNNLFQRLCSVRSFCCRESIFSYLRRAVFILSQANFYSIHFLKVRHFPGKIDNKPLPGVFLKLLSRYNRLSKKSFVRFLYGAGPVANFSLAWPLRGVKSSDRSFSPSTSRIVNVICQTYRHRNKNTLSGLSVV